MVKTDTAAPAIVSWNCGTNNKTPQAKRMTLKTIFAVVKKKPVKPITISNVAQVAVANETKVSRSGPSMIKEVS